jgi:S1-C subfamily serine protease
MDLGKSVVRIAGEYISWSYLYPGIFETTSGTGSGFCVEGKRIITNNHVATNAETLRISFPDSSKSYSAYVVYDVYELDLAILKIHEQDEEEFWKIAKPLKLGEDPKREDKIILTGYAMGSYQFIISRGRILRPDFTDVLLVYQVDAKATHGNSGSAALNQKGDVIGVIYSYTNHDTYKVIQLIPVSHVKLIIKMMSKDSVYRGLCGMHITSQSMINDSISSYYGIEGEYGILVSECKYDKGFKEGDIIMSIDGNPIYKNKSYYDKEREIKLPYWFITAIKSQGEKVDVELIRNKKRIKIVYECQHTDITYSISARQCNQD